MSFDMMNVKINLNREVFYAGEVISGTIEVNLRHPTKLRGIGFLVYGRAKCNWTVCENVAVGQGDNQRTEVQDVPYEGKNVYISKTENLFGNAAAEPVELSSGLHKYDFQFTLPSLIAASFEGKYGNIRYHIEAELYMPSGFGKTYRKNFTVERKDELNSRPELKIPIQLEEVTKFFCWCCKSDPLLMTVTIPFGGFVPGQDIPVKVSYVNKSHIKIGITRVSLKQIVHYTCSSPKYHAKVETNMIVEKTQGGVMSLRNRILENILVIPNAIPNSNGDLCNIIKISYELKIVAFPEGCHFNIALTIPIVIGSDPLIMDSSSVQPTFSGGLDPLDFEPILPYTVENQNENGNNVSPPPNYDQPPSFEEAIRMNAVPGVTSTNTSPGWTIPTGQKSMPMPSVAPPILPYSNSVPSVQPVLPSAPCEEV